MSCACMGPQNGEPLCPCRMRAAREYFSGRHFGTGAVLPVMTLLMDDAREAIVQRDKRIAELEAEVSTLRELLRPFADNK